MIGEMIVNQTEDYTCPHCRSLLGVFITQDDDKSQEWLCTNCAGLCLITKLEGSMQLVQLGRHGPARSSLTGHGCCLLLEESLEIIVTKPTKLKKGSKAKLHPKVAKTVMNEEFLMEGERLSGLFFEKNSLSFEKGFSLGEKLIDFCVHTVEGNILWENADLEESKLEKSTFKAGIESLLRFEHLFTKGTIKEYKRKLAEWDKQGIIGKVGGSWDLSTRISDVLQNKSKQLKNASGKYPVVLALYDRSVMRFASDLHMRLGLLNDRYFRADAYKFVSAIAVLDYDGDAVSVRLYRNSYADIPVPDVFPVDLQSFDKDNVNDTEVIPRCRIQYHGGED